MIITDLEALSQITSAPRFSARNRIGTTMRLFIITGATSIDFLTLFTRISFLSGYRIMVVLSFFTTALFCTHWISAPSASLIARKDVRVRPDLMNIGTSSCTVRPLFVFLIVLFNYITAGSTGSTRSST